MSRYSLWSEYGNIRNYISLPQEEKDRILKILLDKDTPSTYYADLMIHTVADKMDKDDWIKVALNYITNRKNNNRSSYSYAIINSAASIDLKQTKKALLGAESKSIKRYLLVLPDLTLDEEVCGLRALSVSKRAPNALYNKEYAPTLNAIKVLPPVMRLKSLEALSNIGRVSYNIFQNIEEQDFRALLFTVSMRYTDRVQKLSDKFSELKFLGIESTVSVKGFCPKCKDYRITIISKVIRTKDGLVLNNMGRLIGKSCPFCNTILKTKPSFTQK